ncbi:MAG TPA: DHH family phosphoesterase [Pirellulaceae bacterium]|nr:DHH family phosphoesterase [Pirellulaceae bacterium]
MSIDWKQWFDLVSPCQKIVLVSHIRPDCDALGSELGMAGLLSKLGKQVRIVNGQATPPNLQFIDPHGQILALGVDIEASELLDVDLFMILDTSARAQLGSMAAVLDATTAKKIVVDHHESSDELGAVVFKRTSAEATGILVMEAARYAQIPLTPEMARPLFAALATDTGWFRFPSVSAATYQSASELVSAGAVPHEIYGQLYEQETLGRVRLRGVVLARIEVELDGRFAHTYILKEDYTATGALPSDTEDLVNHALEIQGTQFAVILIEQPAGGFKISFRSRCEVACNEVAEEFKGGGHRAAAGAFVKGAFESVQHQVLNHVRQSLRQGNPTEPVGA